MTSATDPTSVRPESPVGLRVVICNNCGADDFDVVFEAGKAQIHRIVKCRRCGLMYANPQTTHSTGLKVSLSAENEMEEAKIAADLGEFTPQKNQYLRKQYLQQNDYDHVLGYLEAFPKGTLVDVGSYAGVFLSRAREKGWAVVGIEPEALPRAYAESEFGLKVYSDPFENCQLSESDVRAIVSFHVIEHVYDPKGFVEKAHDTLTEGGLFVLETPTYDSLLFKVLRHRERSMKCDGHIHLYTRSTLRALVESCGFTVVKHEKVGRTLTLDRLLTNVGIILGDRNLFSRISKRLRLEGAVLRLNMRDMQRVYCRKMERNRN